MVRPRLSVPLEEWPPWDRQAFERALQPGELFTSQGLAAHWAPATRIWAIKGYGHWLRHLRCIGSLDDQLAPAARVSTVALRGYVGDLKNRLARASVAGRMRALLEVLRVIDPSGDHALVRKVCKSTRVRLGSGRDKRGRLVAPSELYLAGIARMRRNRALSTDRKAAAIRYGDGLMMAMLAVKPVRRKNLLGTRIGEHLKKAASGGYEWQFAAHETKTKRAVFVELPTSLTPYLDDWLNIVRPVLLAHKQSDSLWVTTVGTSMAIDTAYGRFCRATMQELGKRINPHLVRDIVATGIAVSMPESVRITPVVLDHCTDQTSRSHYNLADAVSASARYVDRLENLRYRARARRRQEST
jgi:integrase/recombinase XerD